MSDFNSSRQNIIRAIYIVPVILIIGRLIFLQVVNFDEFRLRADDQGIFRKVIYPDRGIIFDRTKKSILENTIISDLMITPSKIRGADTALLCSILGIDSATFHKKLVETIIKNGRTRASVFEPMLTPEKMAKLNENIYKFAPGFYLQDRPVRNFPQDAAGNLLGYVAEVDPRFLERHQGEGYAPGDFAGMTGLERTYEKVLMGQRGIEYWKRDNKNRLTERWEKGEYDTLPVAGSNLYSSVDIELQQLGEKLMQDKLGSIVAIDPKTGGVLCMVTAPSYKPHFLSGPDRRKHFSELFLNPALPLLNRTVSAQYAPGSTFKTLQAIIGLNEGVINTQFTVSCRGAFYGCGSGRPMRCLDYGTFDFRNAIRLSDNTYFATVMQKVINNPLYPSLDSSLNRWAQYMHEFGLGHKLGIDLPAEKPGRIPDAKFYNEAFGKGKWNFCSFRSNSIGQGEIETTPLQVANEMAFIANKGWYYLPHLIDSIEGGDKFGLLDKYKEKHEAMHINDSIYEAVHDGMQMVVDGGTGMNARVKGIAVCGKTGTVENYIRGVDKQPNHTFFCAFAPRENPQIAIMCVIENSGRFGGTWAAPIVGLMIEKYLKDSITDKSRLAKIEQLSKLNLIPKRINDELRKQDSARHAGDTAYLVAKGYITLIKDTLELPDDAIEEDELLKKNKESQNKPDPKKPQKDSIVKVEAVLPPRSQSPPDSLSNPTED